MNTFTKIHFDTKEEWQEYKRVNQIIGGSSASAIIGKNPWRTNKQVWKSLKNKSLEEDIGDKPQVKYGILAERPIRELFALDYPEYEVVNPPTGGYDLLISSINPHLGGTLDGILLEKPTNRKGILEIKTTEILSSMSREQWKDKIPDNYYIQVLHYLLVTDYDFAIVHAQLKYSDGENTWTTRRSYLIEKEPNKEFMKYLLESEIKFIESLKGDIEPALILPSIE